MAKHNRTIVKQHKVVNNNTNKMKIGAIFSPHVAIITIVSTLSFRFNATGNDESCLSILNNFYNDGLKWHDVACHHLKPFVCEDSDELLNFVRSRNAGIRL